MNKEQREYIKAQAELAAAEEQERKLEAEEKLIQYALSIIPMKKEREILRKVAKTNWKAREDMLTIVMKLDTKTVRA